MVERDWHEAADLQPKTALLIVVLLVAAVLRFWGLARGIPYAVGVDEPEIMARVVTMMRTGDLNPHFFDYPGLLFYLHLPVAILNFMVGATQGRWASLAQAGPEHFYLWARAVTAVFGTATVFLVYLAATRWGTRHALLAAALMAVTPLHVRESHYVLTDVPMTFFVTLTWLLSLAAHERPTARAFALAGVAAGLATAAKYTAGLALLLPLIAVWMTLPTKPSRLTAALATVGAGAAAYLVTAPYTLLDLPAFLNGFAGLVGHYLPRQGHMEAGWLVYLKHLRINLQWPALILMFCGLGLAAVRAVRGPMRVPWTLLAVFPLVFFYVIADRVQIYARYLLPIVPFVCTLAAVAVVSGVSLLRRFSIPRSVRTTLTVALTAACLFGPVRTSIEFVRTIMRPSTQDAAYTWIQMNIPEGSNVVLERYDLRLPDAHYRVRHVKWMGRESLEQLRASGAQYLVTTSQVFGPAVIAPEANPVLTEQYRTLFRSTREVARFSPTDRRPGPELRILTFE